jgi:two-component system, chemotaxis family, sensor kinase CheA
MERETFSALLDSMVSDFLCLDAAERDIPSADKFLKQLEHLSRKVEERGTPAMADILKGMTAVMEKVILTEASDRAAGFLAFEKGLSVLQNILAQRDYSAEAAALCETMATLTSDTTRIAESASVIQPQAPASGGDAAAPDAGAATPACDEAVLKDFIAEGLEYLEEIEQNILHLEQHPQDKTHINAIFRPFHSIKGIAAFLNLVQIRDLAHLLENLLDEARNGALPVSSTFIDVVLDGADTLKDMIGQLRQGASGDDFDLSVWENRVTKLVRDPMEKGGTRIGEILVEEGIITEESLKNSLAAAQGPHGPQRIGETLIREGKATLRQISRALRTQANRASDAATIRVETRKLDDLIDMVGELVITQSMIRQDLANMAQLDRDLMRDITQSFRIASGLQRTSTSLRMIPIRRTFQRISRLIRDLARDSGKVVSVELVGEETEIDRNMVDEIYPPLVHLARNAVDHGIEMLEDRRKAGKDERGTIRLQASHRKGNIVIEVSDDGRGLNREKILAGARKLGVADITAGGSDGEIDRLVFVPGLSTAQAVSDISGRGVGMDVVKQAVEKMRGKIEIDSSTGRGTSFVIRLPLTMAIIDGMIVSVGSERYILPTHAIRQTLRPTRDACSRVAGKEETIHVMGQFLPLVRLHNLFAVETDCRDPWEAIVMVVESDNRAKCLLVDDVLGKTEVVIKALSGGLKHTRGIAGGAVMGDGQIGLILDPEGLFELSERS